MLTASLLVACRPDGPTKTPDGEAKTVGKSRARTPDGAAALAERIDPGPTKGLAEGMPPAASSRFLAGVGKDTANLLALLEQWREMPASASVDHKFQLLAGIAFSTIVLEGDGPDAVKDPKQLGALGIVYGNFDIPGLVDPGGLFAPTLVAVANALARDPSGALEDARGAEMFQWVSTALGRLPALHRRVAARLLVEQPTHPELPTILERVASTTMGDPQLVVDLRRHAMTQRGRYAKAVHHRELAYACFSVLDLECGDTELAAVRASKEPPAPDDATRLVAVEGQRTKAARVIALAKATSVDERLERARLLSELGDRPGAMKEFDAVAKDHPRDARAVAGKIAVRLSGNFDVDAAYEALLANKGELEHRGRDYLELSVGVRAMAIGKTLIPKLMAGGDTNALLDGLLPALEPVRRDATLLAGLGVEKGEVLVFLFAISDELVPHARKGDNEAMVKIAHGLLPRALELRRKMPKSPYAYDVMLAAVQFSPDRKAVLDAVAAPVPVPDDAALAMRAAMTRLTLALQFEDRATVAAVTKQIEAWPESFGAAARSRALARVDAVSWRLSGDAVARDRAISRYGAVVTSDATPADLTDVANFAVLLADAGKPQDAAAVLQRAQSIDGSSALVQLLAATLAPTPDIAALERVTQQSEHQLAIAALVWLAAVDPDKKKRAVWAKALDEKRRESSLRGGKLPGNTGLGASASLNVNVGYSSRNGLELILDAGPVPRLYLRPPKTTGR